MHKQIPTVLFSLCTLILLLVATTGPVRAEDSGPAYRAEQAKAAYLTNPSPETRADMDAAVEALQAATAQQRTAKHTGQAKALVGESEPNDAAGSADALVQGESGNGGLTPVGDIDWWSAAAAVDELVFSFVDPATSSASLDSQLNLYADDATTLIEFDDDDGPDLGSCIAGAIVPQAGNVYYRVNEFSDDQEITPYGLYQLVTGTTSSEVESNDTCATASPIQWVTIGSLPAGDTVDWYAFTAEVDDTIVVIMDDDPNDDANALDTDIAIIGSDCSTVLASGDNGSGNHGNCAGAAVAPATDTYYLQVVDGGFGDGDTDYRFVVLVNGEPVVPVTLQSFSLE